MADEQIIQSYKDVCDELLMKYEVNDNILTYRLSNFFVWMSNEDVVCTLTMGRVHSKDGTIRLTPKEHILFEFFNHVYYNGKESGKREVGYKLGIL